MAENAGTTVVGPSILINGSLQGDEDLTVLGRVEGSISLTKTLHVEESGIVKADIAVRNAVVSGVVVGNITASDSVEITEAGRMVGDIKAPRVIIVDGARFRGTVDMGDLEATRPTGPLPERTVGRAMGKPMGMPARKPTMPIRTAAPTKPNLQPVAKKPLAEAAKAAAPASDKSEKKADTATPEKSDKKVFDGGPRAGAPMLGGKKLKKKVVVKKKG